MSSEFARARVVPFLWILALASTVAPSPALPAAPPPVLGAGKGTIEFVRNGEALGVYEPDRPWSRGERMLEGSGNKAFLLADHDIGSGDFEVRAVLSISPSAESKAFFEFGGGKLFFSGAEGRIATVGVPKGEKEVTYGESARFFADGKPFEFRLAREGPRLRAWIDRQEVFELKVKKRPLGRFGFNPGTSTMRLVRFSASGDLRDVDRRVRIDPTEFAHLEAEERVDRAIESGIEYLLAQIRGQQEAYGVGNHAANVSGAIACETYALVVAGIPIDDPLLVANFRTLDRTVVKKGRIYDLACTLFALDAAIAQLEHDALLTERDIDPRALSSLGKRQRKSMKRALERLLEGQLPGGAWRYDVNSKDFDHSCTQFAALGLGVAARRGIGIPNDVWVRAAEHWITHQQESGPTTDRRATLKQGDRPEFEWSRAEREGREKKKKRGKGGRDDGGTSVAKVVEPDPFVGDETVTVTARGWEYAKKATDKATWNMTCAGVSSLMLIYTHGGHALSPELRKDVSRSIRDGIGWLLEHWTPHGSLYSLYSLEKVADLGGIELFDLRDWYDDAREWLLVSQVVDGSWKGNGTGEVPRVSTALALLVLRRASTLLSRNPADEIIVTGPGSRNALSTESRVWIYVTRLDRAVSFPGLLRTLRLRPAVPLLRLLEEVCAEYPADQSPEAISALIEARGRVRGKGPVATIDRCLALTAGRELGGVEEYREFFERWLEIESLEEESLGNPTGRLEELYRLSSEDPRVLRKIIPILIRRSARESLPTLLPDLEHRDVAIRGLVYRAVQAFHRDTPPPFRASAPAAERQGQAAAVRAWVEERRGARSPGGSGGGR